MNLGPIIIALLRSRYDIGLSKHAIVPFGSKMELTFLFNFGMVLGSSNIRKSNSAIWGPDSALSISTVLFPEKKRSTCF